MILLVIRHGESEADIALHGVLLLIVVFGTIGICKCTSKETDP